MLWGAVLLVLADTVARFIAAPAELPVGIITTLLGSPFFLSLAFSKNGLFNGKK
jgi:iron complex transport system permease protein